MIEHLVTAIRTCDPDISSAEVADVLGLAQFLGPSTPETRSVAGAARPPLAGRTRPSGGGESWQAEARSTAKVRESLLPQPLGREPPSPSDDQASFRLLGGRLPDTLPSVFARSPAVPAIPNQLALSRW